MSRTSTRSTSSSFGCSWSRDGPPTRSRPPSGCGRKAFQSRQAGGQRSALSDDRPTDRSAATRAHPPTAARHRQRGGSGRVAEKRQRALAKFSQELVRRGAGVPGVPGRSRRTRCAQRQRSRRCQAFRASRPGSRTTKPCWSTWWGGTGSWSSSSPGRLIGEDESRAASRPDCADRTASGPHPPPR